MDRDLAKFPSQRAFVRTFADHELILPPNKLKGAVSPLRPGEPEDNPVARGEAALAKLAIEFPAWMNAECDRLDRARNRVKLSGFTGLTRDELFRVAHDINGQAATFGFPQAAGVAESLCRLIERALDKSRIPLHLVDQHVDAVRAIIREGNVEGAAETAEALAARLRQVTEDFLVQEQRSGPRDLDGFAPPLAPRESS